MRASTRARPGAKARPAVRAEERADRRGVDRCTILAGTASRGLADAVAREAGVPLGRVEVERFPDGELTVRIDESVRDRDVFLLQATSSPVNEHLVELLALADACRRGSAGRITAVVPYFGYARSDRRAGRREPIMAGLVAEVLEAAGVDHVVVIDLHTPQVEGFFRVPVDHLTAIPVLAEAARDRLEEGTVVVSPDVGAVDRATAFARRLGLGVAITHKRRVSGERVEVVRVIGEVEGKACLIVDDMISTGGTVAACVAALREAGAGDGFMVAATHAVLSPGARERLADAGVREVIVTNTVASEGEAWPALRVVSVAPLLAGAVRRLIAGESLSGLA